MSYNTCKVCEYFIRNNGIFGECRYNPPVIRPNNKSKWPEVTEDGGCGKCLPIVRASRKSMEIEDGVSDGYKCATIALQFLQDFYNPNKE